MSGSVRLLIGVLVRRDSGCGCVPPYPLFIHSLLSQSLGNETGDGNEDLRGGSSLAPFILLCSSHLSLWICSSPLRHLRPSKALDHFKMSGPSLQMAETGEKYHHSYLGLQTMNPNCSWDEGLPRADRALLSLIKRRPVSDCVKAKIKHLSQNIFFWIPFSTGKSFYFDQFCLLVIWIVKSK